MIIDSDSLPEQRDLAVLVGAARAGAYGFDITDENFDGLARLGGRGLVKEHKNGLGKIDRVFLTRAGERALIALTGSCPDEEAPADLGPFTLGGAT